MTKKTKAVITAISVSAFLNLVFVTLFIIAALNPVKSVSFYPAGTDDFSYASAACIVSFPRGDAETEFGSVTIKMKPGDKCSLQYSLLADGKQLNVVSEAIYDRSIVNIERTGYGHIIHALKTGECVLQLLAEDGIRDFAKIIITE